MAPHVIEQVPAYPQAALEMVKGRDQGTLSMYAQQEKTNQYILASQP